MLHAPNKSQKMEHNLELDSIWSLMLKTYLGHSLLILFEIFMLWAGGHYFRIQLLIVIEKLSYWNNV